MTKSKHGPLRIGVGGPVGSGKTALMDALCKRLRQRFDIAAITNDIYTKEDAEFLTRSGALAQRTDGYHAAQPARDRTLGYNAICSATPRLLRFHCMEQPGTPRALKISIGREQQRPHPGRQGNKEPGKGSGLHES